MEGATWIPDVDEGGDMNDLLRLSQGLSQCHVDEGSSRMAAEVRTNSLSSKVGECVGPSIGIFNYVNDASLGSSNVVNMADGGGDRLPPRPSGGLHTSSSGGISQRRLEQEQPFPGNLSRNAAITDASSLSLSFSNLNNNSNTNESSIVTAGNENDNGGGNNGTMMTRMVDCKHRYGADDRFVPSGVLSNSAFDTLKSATKE
ncbi:hypothetical protein ACHAW5_011175 [Stephanodiscus triporus]|uniref:Uncharacterized protein n=1 Tax=Stephanodiscus triporus TaxID=2934178 RepID=A0ABD3MRU9_9STRA